MHSLDWKWIGIGVIVMIVLTLLGGVIAGLVLGLPDATSPEQIQLSGGQIAVLAAINFLAFAIGGIIVGLKSAGRTIVEPGISAAIAVAITLLISHNLTIMNIIGGGLVPFLAGVLGGWFGEQQQALV